MSLESAPPKTGRDLLGALVAIVLALLVYFSKPRTTNPNAREENHD